MYSFEFDWIRFGSERWVLKEASKPVSCFIAVIFTCLELFSKYKNRQSFMSGVMFNKGICQLWSNVYRPLWLRAQNWTIQLQNHPPRRQWENSTWKSFAYLLPRIDKPAALKKAFQCADYFVSRYCLCLPMVAWNLEAYIEVVHIPSIRKKLKPWAQLSLGNCISRSIESRK